MMLSAGLVAQAGPQSQMPQVIREFAADWRALDSTYSVDISPVRGSRLEEFYDDTQAKLAAMNFDALSQEDKVDYLLLKNHVTAEQHQLALWKKQIDEMTPRRMPPRCVVSVNSGIENAVASLRSMNQWVSFAIEPFSSRA
jgi:hypothetical protein